jgi:hypothetical protein
MGAEFYFTITYLPFLALQGMSLAAGGRTGELMGGISYIFAIGATCSYVMFISKIV